MYFCIILKNIAKVEKCCEIKKKKIQNFEKSRKCCRSQKKNLKECLQTLLINKIEKVEKLNFYKQC